MVRLQQARACRDGDRLDRHGRILEHQVRRCTAGGTGAGGLLSSTGWAGTDASSTTR